MGAVVVVMVMMVVPIEPPNHLVTTHSEWLLCTRRVDVFGLVESSSPVGCQPLADCQIDAGPSPHGGWLRIHPLPPAPHVVYE